MSVLWVIAIIAFAWYLRNRQAQTRIGGDLEWEIHYSGSPSGSFGELEQTCGGSASSEGRNRRSRARARERFWRGVRDTNTRIRQNVGKVRKIKSLFRNTPQAVVTNQVETVTGDSLAIREARLRATAQELGSDGAEYIASLESLRAERETAQERWVAKLDSVAKQLDELHSDIKTCVVDLEPIRPGERAVRLPCLHEFHADCLLPYFATLDNPACPIDRQPVPRESVSSLPVWIVPERKSNQSNDELD